MKLLTVVLVLLVAYSNVVAQSSSTTNDPVTTSESAGSTGGGTDGSTVPVGTGSTPPPGTGPTSPSGSTVTDGSNTGSTPQAATTTPTPIKLSTFPVSNDVSPLDAKLILQQAVQLDQQIKALNDYLVKAQADTNPANSPLFAQLQAFTGTINTQNATLQGYLTQLQSLATSQSDIDNRLSSATSTFVCFSQSSCVTDVPTTPEPTSPGPTPPVAPCSNKTLTADLTETKSYSKDQTQNAALCAVFVKPSNTYNNVTVTINVTITGPDAYVKLVETRTQNSATINGTLSGYSFNGFEEVDVYYYSGPRSTVQFNFDYIEVNSCNRNCSGSNGVCKVSPSGVQYCECKPCEYTGDNCEKPISDPCQSKQKRNCGSLGDKPFGTCYRNSCFDQCYACACSPGTETDSPQKCLNVNVTDPSTPVVPTGNPVCPSTLAPTTTPVLLTSTVAPSVAVSTSASVGGSTAVPASPQTTVTSGSTDTTGSSASSTGSPDTTILTTADSSSTTSFMGTGE